MYCAVDGYIHVWVRLSNGDQQQYFRVRIKANEKEIVGKVLHV